MRPHAGLTRTARNRAVGDALVAALLVVVGCVLAPPGVVAAWTADTVSDTDRYVRTVTPLASHPDIQDAVATGPLGIALRIARALYPDALPAGLSQPTAAAVHDALTRFPSTTVRMVVAVGPALALGAWLTGPGRRAGLVRRLWTSGIEAVRATADGAGLRKGPVGPFVRRYRTWIGRLLVAAALPAYLLWSYPTGWVAVGPALALLFVLGVVEFLAAGEGPVDEDPGLTRTA
ncbi:hypothetical protein [Streptomyces hokutonensis]|uniref:hypothetical protein n=1 Tax=Streptomyces hokutonensis TaxID=1306990 RepID=UPI0033E7000C